jgi:hypothetical protein
MLFQRSQIVNFQKQICRVAIKAVAGQNNSGLKMDNHPAAKKPLPRIFYFQAGRGTPSMMRIVTR